MKVVPFFSAASKVMHSISCHYESRYEKLVIHPQFLHDKESSISGVRENYLNYGQETKTSITSKDANPKICLKW